jgi:hypothetical protein
MITHGQVLAAEVAPGRVPFSQFAYDCYALAASSEMLHKASVKMRVGCTTPALAAEKKGTKQKILAFLETAGTPQPRTVIEKAVGKTKGQMGHYMIELVREKQIEKIGKRNNVCYIAKGNPCTK